MALLAVVVHYARSDRARRLFPNVTTLCLVVLACVTGSPWQDALRADLALCNAGKDALRGEVAAASAAIAVLQRDRVREHGWPPLL